MVASDPRELFDPGTLRKFEAAGLLARRMARGRERASRRSASRGASVEFSEHRPMVQGDDPRLIDWNAFARWRQLVLRLTVAEEDLHVHFLLDCSASMGRGEPPKFDQARRVLGGLAFLALANLDRASFFSLGHERAQALAPTRGRERFHDFLRVLAGCGLAPGAPSLDAGVRAWLARKPRKGVAVLVGDLFGDSEGDALRAVARLRQAGFDVAAVQVLDPGELVCPPRGEYEFEDCESGRIARVALDASAERAYESAVERWKLEIERDAAAAGSPFMRVTPSDDLSAILAEAARWQ